MIEKKESPQAVRNRIVGAMVAACLLMGVVDAVVRPGYLIKSLLKLALFLLLPWLVYYRNKPDSWKPLFAWKRTGIAPLLLGVCVYGGILGLYFAIGRFFDFSMVTGALKGDLGIDAKNFLAVSLYISFVNSLLEEFFFRGFGFLTLKSYASRRFSYLCSAGLFALYHVAMLVGWFRLDLLTLLIGLLVAAGVVLESFNEKSGTLWFSWFIHMFANFSINTIGFFLFGII